jgi:hypothetical protein
MTFLSIENGKFFPHFFFAAKNDILGQREKIEKISKIHPVF